jgi:hypothetical protein
VVSVSGHRWTVDPQKDWFNLFWQMSTV